MVSVLSNLSLASGLSAAESARSEKQSSFAIGGLEHTLLSRGTVTAKSELEEGGGHNAGELVLCFYHQNVFFCLFFLPLHLVNAFVFRPHHWHVLCFRISHLLYYFVTFVDFLSYNIFLQPRTSGQRSSTDGTRPSAVRSASNEAKPRVPPRTSGDCAEKVRARS